MRSRSACGCTACRCAWPRRRCRDRLVQGRLGRIVQTAFHHQVRNPDPAVWILRLHLGEGLKFQEGDLPVSQTELHRSELGARLDIAWLQAECLVQLAPSLIELPRCQMCPGALEAARQAAL